MEIAEIIFWISWILLAYHLVGYWMILFLFNSLFRKKKAPFLKEEFYPSITVICPAYNEEKVMEAKIQSFLNLDYPQDKIKMIVISDDSTDRTNEIVQKYTNQNISLIIQKPRAGKPNALNLVLPLLDSDYVLSTDADCLFEPQCVKMLVANMLSDEKIGLVSGNVKKVQKGKLESGEGFYWKYEAFLKLMESRFNTIIGGVISKLKEIIYGYRANSPDDFERVLNYYQVW